MDEEQLLWCKVAKQVDAIAIEENVVITDSFKNALNELTKEKLKQTGNDLKLFMEHRTIHLDKSTSNGLGSEGKLIKVSDFKLFLRNNPQLFEDLNK